EQFGAMTLGDFGARTIWSDGSPCGYDDYPAARCLRTGIAQPPTTIGIRRSSGQLMWTNVAVAPLAQPVTGEADSVLDTFMDISYSKQIEDSLSHSEERYRMLIEQAPDAIVVHRNGTIEFLNDAAVRLWGGRSRSDFLHRDILDFVHPRHRTI